MRTISLRLSVVVAIGAGAIGCAKFETPAAPVELSIEGRSNAHVTLAADHRRLAAAWIASSDAGADVFVAVSDDGGRRFGAPVRVNDTAGDAAGNGEQPPRIVLEDSGMTVVWV